MAESPDDMIQMAHSEFPVTVAPWTTVRAFKQVWEQRGWVRADQATLTAAGILGEPVPDLEGLTKRQLLEVARNLEGVEVSARATNPDLIEAIRAAPAVAAATPPEPTTEEETT